MVRSTTHAIGIDLGTSKCCVGVVVDGRVEIIEDEQGNKLTPAFVAFTETERLFGGDAKSQFAVNPRNTVYGIKRILGLRYDDEALQQEIKQYPFKVLERGGKPVIKVEYRGEERFLRPEQLSAMMITKMKKIAESYLGSEVSSAVISVPASFTTAQRQATLHAGEIAGLQVLRLINETTAAAIAYADRRNDATERVLILDFGAGKLDVALVDVKHGSVEVLKTCGDTFCGGCDFDTSLVELLSRNIKEDKHEDVFSRKALVRLRLAAEQLKHKLSLLSVSQVHIDSLAINLDFTTSVSRENFNATCTDLFKRTITCILEQILGFNSSGSALNTESIDKVILIGGSTRVPFVQEILQKLLAGKKLEKSVNPDEAVAYGAALQAALLSGEPSVPDIDIQDIYSHEILYRSGNQTGCLFQRFISIPTQKSYIAKSSTFHKCYNLLEGRFIPRKGGGEFSQEEYAFSEFKQKAKFAKALYNIDCNGIFNTIINIDGNEYHLDINSDSINTRELRDMIQEEDNYKRDDANEKERIECMSDLESCCYQLKSEAEKLLNKSFISENAVEEVLRQCDQTIDWLDDHQTADKAECEKRKRELQSFADLIKENSDEHPNSSIDDRKSCAKNLEPSRDLSELDNYTNTDKLFSNSKNQDYLSNNNVYKGNDPINEYPQNPSEFCRSSNESEQSRFSNSSNIGNNSSAQTTSIEIQTKNGSEPRQVQTKQDNDRNSSSRATSSENTAVRRLRDNKKSSKEEFQFNAVESRKSSITKSTTTTPDSVFRGHYLHETTTKQYSEHDELAPVHVSKHSRDEHGRHWQQCPGTGTSSEVIYMGQRDTGTSSRPNPYNSGGTHQYLFSDNTRNSNQDSHPENATQVYPEVPSGALQKKTSQPSVFGTGQHTRLRAEIRQEKKKNGSTVVTRSAGSCCVDGDIHISASGKSSTNGAGPSNSSSVSSNAKKNQTSIEMDRERTSSCSSFNSDEYVNNDGKVTKVKKRFSIKRLLSKHLNINF